MIVRKSILLVIVWFWVSVQFANDGQGKHFWEGESSVELLARREIRPHKIPNDCAINWCFLESRPIYGSAIASSQIAPEVIRQVWLYILAPQSEQLLGHPFTRICVPRSSQKVRLRICRADANRSQMSYTQMVTWACLRCNNVSKTEEVSWCWISSVLSWRVYRIKQYERKQIEN